MEYALPFHVREESSGFERNQDNSKVGVLYDRVRGMFRLPWLLRFAAYGLPQLCQS